ncbi:hypothetical protein [Halostagnicola kamekurae]|uniref:hypothetical protein n=1 Tax=Halostagnicola kamekurae TaxID=619731 RepID=UPI001FE5E65A|nr:hypothetical protein [Halostagnicola kamekurae]
MTYDELEINEGIDDETFTYDPPPNAEVKSIGAEPIGVFDTPAAAEAELSFDLPNPAIPDGFELDRITVLNRGFGTTATSWYVEPTTPERELFVAVREQPRFHPDVLTPIDIAGHEAYRRAGGLESIFWECEGVSYEVSSPHPGEPLEEIVASIGCPE